MIQKLKRSLASVLLVIGLPLAAVVPVLVTAPVQAAAGGTCILDTVQGDSVQKVDTCAALLPSMTDNSGKTMDPTRCYELSQYNGVRSIGDELDCTNPRLDGVAVVRCTDGTKAPNNDVTQCSATPYCGDLSAQSSCNAGRVADPAATSGNCSTFAKCDLIEKYINPLINLLAALVGVAVVVSLIIGGIQYGSSAGDSQKVTAAKNRIRNAIVALITFIFLYALLNFLIPGGLLIGK